MDKYIKYIRYMAALAIIGMFFYGGCTSSSTIMHEPAGVIIPSITPAASTLTSNETSEAEIVKTGKFSPVTIAFQNLNAIPITIKYYKIEYTDSYTGEKLSSLSFGSEMVFTISGNTGTSTSSSSTTTTASAAASSSTASTSGNNVTLPVVDSKTKVEMYRNVNDPTDNRVLGAKITFYGTDYNANGLEFNASVTIVP